MLKWFTSICGDKKNRMMEEILLKDKEYDEYKNEIYSLTELLSTSKKNTLQQKEKVYILRGEISSCEREIDILRKISNGGCIKDNKCNHDDCAFKSTIVLVKTLKGENTSILNSNNYLNQIYKNLENKYNNDMYNLEDKINFLNGELNNSKKYISDLNQVLINEKIKYTNLESMHKVKEISTLSYNTIKNIEEEFDSLNKE